MNHTPREIKKIVEDILAAKKETGGVRQVYFAGCGGSLGTLYPASKFMQVEFPCMKSGWINSNEFVHSTPKDFGENSILVVGCHNGDTPESVAAARLGKEKGATVILLTGKEESDLVQYGDFIVLYTEEVSGEKAVCALLLAIELLNQTEGYAHYDAFLDGVSKIDGIVARACGQVEQRALAFAAKYQDDKFIYTMGSGASYSSAYMESICILMEMQWINSACIHTGEYFHGPFEVTDANVPFIIQIAEGPCRALDERALKFLKTYGKRIEVLDAKELGLSTIDPSVVEYFNHSLFNNVYPVYNKALAEKRQHPLSTRRYMWKVEY